MLFVRKLFSMVALALLLGCMLTLASPAVQVKSWVYNDGQPEDTKYETFGPRADKLLIKLYPDEIAEWDALERDEIDITDSPLSRLILRLNAHKETVAMSGENYYLLKTAHMEVGGGITLAANMSSTGRKLWGKFVYSLQGLSVISPSTWTINYRTWFSYGLPAGECRANIDVAVCRSDGTIRSTIATNVADSDLLTTTPQTLFGRFSWLGYGVVDQTDYLEIDFYAEVTTERLGAWAYLRIDDYSLSWIDQTRVDNIVRVDYFDRFTSPPLNQKINVVSYGSEFILCLFDLNNNNNQDLDNPPNPAFPNPVYPNPMSELALRKAVAFLSDRVAYVNYVGPVTAAALYTPLPLSLGEYAHPDIKPSGSREDLCYLYSPTVAYATLDAGGFPVGPDGWRYWDRNHNGVKDAGEDFTLKIVARVDDPNRDNAGSLLYVELINAGIHTDIQRMDSVTAKNQVMWVKDFHIYTGGWSSGGVDPDFLTLWAWDYYWHPGYCQNYDGCNNADFNNYTSRIMNASTFEEAKNNAWLAQEVFASEVLSIPLWSDAGYKAYYKTNTGTSEATEGGTWLGVTNIQGIGIDNPWTLMNMHTDTYETHTDMTIDYGFKTTKIRSFNPIYAEYMWDNKIMGLIYNSLLYRNPNNQTELEPWLAESFEVGTYTNPVYGTCTKIKFALRPEATWVDGEPITASDVHFTLKELPDILKERGLPSPWWFSSVRNIAGFRILDAYNFEILLNITSVFAAGQIGTNIILPRHIWLPIVESGDPWGVAPDPNLVGSGPWRLEEYVENSHVLMVANKLGRTVQTNLPVSTPVTSPKGFFMYKPIFAEARVDGTTNAKIDCYTQPHKIDYIIRNSYLDGPVTIDVSVTYPNGSTYSAVGVAIAAGGSWQHSWTGEITGKKVTSIHMDIVSPSAFAGTYDWNRVFWSTIKEDITGSHHADPSLPASDIMVDIKDLALVSKSFGTYPGNPSWNKWGKYSDVISDYKVDIKDIAIVAKKFGWGVYP